jgi:CHAD domain-containing protein
LTDLFIVCPQNSDLLNIMEKLLLEYCIQQHSNIAHYLNLCVERAEAESVHQLRVSIKKFRAVSKLLEYLMPEAGRENKQQLGKLRELFKLAGQLRDSQVHMILFNYYKTELNIEDTGFEYFLKKNEMSALRKFLAGFSLFNKTIANQPFHKLNLKKTELDTAESLRPGASKLLEKRLKKLRKTVLAAENDRILHNARIQLKQIRYMLGILTMQDSFFEKYDIAMTGLRVAEIQLGRWHDLVVFRVTLNKYLKRKQKKNAAGQNEILTLNAAVTIDIEIYKEQIMSSFRKYLQ